ncbi:MAG: nucleotide pyrophosphohydrolase [Fibrobacterales bacterium]
MSDAVDKPVDLKPIQENVQTWIDQVGVRYFSELTNMTILTEEVGELARLMARTYGDQSFKKSDLGKNIGDEISDILFVLTCIANQTGVDLSDAWQKGMDKRYSRDKDRHKNNEKLQS